jgi:tRNA pseudouridine32 synthase/23S rRNA pseudouridine746 synthase
LLAGSVSDALALSFMPPAVIAVFPMSPEEMVSRLLYRDGLMLVIDKPAGMAVHRGPKGGESLEDFFDGLRFGLPRAPALAHRLDRDTSGCLVLGRHRKALAELGRLFKTGRIGKTYWAVVEGGPEAGEGRIELPLGRLDETRGWWMQHDPKGQPAVTTWKVLGRCDLPDPAPGCPHLSSPPGTLSREPRAASDGEDRAAPPGLTWLALEPLTGRTHQLRVHCAAMGWPIVGDAIYGARARLHRLRNEPHTPRGSGPGLQLHAREVVIPLYKNREPIKVIAPVPDHLRQRLAACGADVQ